MGRLIETSDGFLIEVESEDDQKVSAGSAKKVEKGLSQIGPLLAKACKKIGESWPEEPGAVEIEQVEIELGFNFEASGNVYIAQATAGASISVTATITKPK